MPSRGGAGHRPEDPRLPGPARWVPFGGRPRCHPRDRARAHRAVARSRLTVIARAWPTLLVVAACLGLAAANAAGAPALTVVASGAAAAGAVASARFRLVAGALALLLAGWWWGSLRLDALDRSVLLPEVGRSAPLTAVVTGPARRTMFTLRVPAEVHRFGRRTLRERVLLELPLGRSPPQGAVLVLRATVTAPRGPDDGFDERGWLAPPRRPCRHRGRRLAPGRPARRDRRRLRRPPRPSRAGDRPWARRRAPGGAGRDRAGRGRRADRGAQGQLQGLGPLPPPGRVRSEHRLSRVGGARPRVAPRHLALAGGSAGDRGDRRLRPRGRVAAVGRPCRDRRRPRLARVAALPSARPLALPGAGRGRRCSRGRRRACSSRASSSRSPQWRRSSSSYPG